MKNRATCYKDWCRCTHEEPCERGWIWIVETVQEKRRNRDGDTIISNTNHEAVTPCPTCDPERAEIFRTSKSLEERDKRLRERSSARRQESYENAEQDRTRTL